MPPALATESAVCQHTSPARALERVCLPPLCVSAWVVLQQQESLVMAMLGASLLSMVVEPDGESYSDHNSWINSNR